MITEINDIVADINQGIAKEKLKKNTARIMMKSVRVTENEQNNNF